MSSGRAGVEHATERKVVRAGEPVHSALYLLPVPAGVVRVIRVDRVVVRGDVVPARRHAVIGFEVLGPVESRVSGVDDGR